EQKLRRSAIQLPLRQLRGRTIWKLSDNLSQDPLRLVAVTQPQLDIGELVQGVRHLVVLRVKLTDLGERLTGTLQVALGEIDLAQPVLRIAGILAIRILAQERAESLA